VLIRRENRIGWPVFAKLERGLSRRGPLKRKFRPRCYAKTRAGSAVHHEGGAGQAAMRFHGGLSVAMYVLVAVMWLIPDRRIERILSEL
jgi:hypothetical protein